MVPPFFSGCSIVKSSKTWAKLKRKLCGHSWPFKIKFHFFFFLSSHSLTDSVGAGHRHGWIDCVMPARQQQQQCWWLRARKNTVRVRGKHTHAHTDPHTHAHKHTHAKCTTEVWTGKKPDVLQMPKVIYLFCLHHFLLIFRIGAVKRFSLFHLPVSLYIPTSVDSQQISSPLKMPRPPCHLAWSKKNKKTNKQLVQRSSLPFIAPFIWIWRKATHAVFTACMMHVKLPQLIISGVITQWKKTGEFLHIYKYGQKRARHCVQECRSRVKHL